MSNEKITKELESVKLDSYWIDKVRENKVKTRVPIAAFIEEAIKEKLEKEDKK